MSDSRNHVSACDRRLAPVADFLAATPRLDALGRRMLRAADVTEPFMRAAVADLVAEARPLTDDATAADLFAIAVAIYDHPMASQ